jgi:hypothetical protein
MLAFSPATTARPVFTTHRTETYSTISFKPAYTSGVESEWSINTGKRHNTHLKYSIRVILNMFCITIIIIIFVQFVHSNC